MHAKTDSEVTSSAPSSPDHHRRPVYYVQSPSRDSHDGEKTMTSFHSTPVIGSPAGSPPHSHSSVGRHSRESSTSRFSGSLKPGSRKISPNDVGSGGRGQRKGQKNWKEFDMIEEEGLLEDEERRQGLPRRCYVLAFVVGFFVLFSFFALILLAASKPQNPRIAMKSIAFERIVVQAGSDDSGVATDLISLNSTVAFNFRNRATFFGVHVTSTPLALSYSQLNIGSGDLLSQLVLIAFGPYHWQLFLNPITETMLSRFRYLSSFVLLTALLALQMKQFYQRRKTQRNVIVSVIGDKIPLYGNGPSMSTLTGTTTQPVPLKLDFTVRSRAYILGKLVKPKFYKKIGCSIVLDPKKLNAPISLKNSCTYD